MVPFHYLLPLGFRPGPVGAELPPSLQRLLPGVLALCRWHNKESVTGGWALQCLSLSVSGVASISGFRGKGWEGVIQFLRGTTVLQRRGAGLRGDSLVAPEDNTRLPEVTRRWQFRSKRPLCPQDPCRGGGLRTLSWASVSRPRAVMLADMRPSLNVCYINLPQWACRVALELKAPMPKGRNTGVLPFAWRLSFGSLI